MKLGRPSLPPEIKKRRIPLYLDLEERQALLVEADRRGISLSACIRVLALLALAAKEK